MGTGQYTPDQDGLAPRYPEWEALLEQLLAISKEHQSSNPYAFDFSDDWNSVAPTYATMLSEREVLLSRVEELTRTLDIATEALSQSNANCRRLQSVLENVSDGLSQVASSVWARPLRSSLQRVVSRAQLTGATG